MAEKWKMPCAPDKVQRVACVGTGTIGGGWVAYYLAHGLKVQAYDPNPTTANGLKAAVEAMWPSLEELGLSPGASISNLKICDSLKTAADGAEYVQESILERKEMKIDLFGQLGDLLPADVIIATSSSRFIPSDLAAKCKNPQRCIVAHPFAPTYLLPIVELLGSPATPPELLDWAVAFFEHIGKAPVVLKKEIEGYIGNRLQAAYVDEARRLVEEGYCDYEDIDRVIMNSFGPRLAFMGLSHFYHLGGGRGGVEHTLMQFGWKGTDESREALLRAVKKISDKASIPELEKWRDGNLVRLLKARRPSPGFEK
ncbi:MAG: 3-hydroxyacyl-CoA dehydrogenase NAD-binding domain-containing protein [Pseudorhodoplanes sp.]